MMLCLFMILQGFCMPTFMDFTYSFALNVQGISKFTIGIAPVMTGIGGVMVPFLFNKYLVKKETASNVMLSQLMVIIASFSCIL
jgi:predicted membrane-bound mannosyltransferase